MCGYMCGYVCGYVWVRVSWAVVPTVAVLTVSVVAVVAVVAIGRSLLAIDVMSGGSL